MANVVQDASKIWHLRDWFAATDLKQRDLITKLDYASGTAFKLWHGFQAPTALQIQQVAELLNIEPFELLMHPEEAMRMRRLKQTIAEVAAAERPSPPPAGEASRTGTDG